MRKRMLIAMPVLFASVSALAVCSGRGLARDNGQWQNVDPEIRKWFRDQKSPKTGGYCCNESDGTYAEEEIRDGHYWTRFEQSNGRWIPVPDDVVIRNSNRNGAPVAWWFHDNGTIQIRCYAPGGKV